VAHLALIVSLVGVGCLWLWQPCVTPWLCRTQNATFGLVYALFASQLIVAHMAKEPFAPNYAVLLLFAGAALNRSVQWVQPHAVTWVVFVLVLSAYLHYVVSVIRQICGHLDIPCLTIRPKKQAAAAGADE
jgi:ethanolaminephosphotransferase